MTNVILETSNGVTKISLNKPPLNVIDIALMQELSAALDRIGPESKVVVIGAQGKLFSAGVDIKDHTPDRVGLMLSEFHKVIRQVWSLKQPTVAALQGSALGGGLELALVCDFIIAAEKAKLGQPEIQVGAYPPVAALLLPHLITRSRALEMILTGDSIDAATAERFGLVNVVASESEFANAVDTFVARLTKLSGVVLQMAKRATRVSDDNLSALTEIEQMYLGELMKTQDAEEGLKAFMEKRAAKWKDA